MAKKGLLIVGSLVVIGGVVGYILWKRKKDKDAKAEVDAKAKTDADANNPNANNAPKDTTVQTPQGSTAQTPKGSTTVVSNFAQLQKNLNAKANANNVVSVNFNNGKNRADFYSNNRFAIFTNGVTGYLKKGSYSNGGKTLITDNGANIASGSVYTNLLSALK